MITDWGRQGRMGRRGAGIDSDDLVTYCRCSFIDGSCLVITSIAIGQSAQKAACSRFLGGDKAHPRDWRTHKCVYQQARQDNKGVNGQNRDARVVNFKKIKKMSARHELFPSF